MKSACAHFRRGFILLNVMAAIALLIAFSILAIELTLLSLRVPARAAERENAILHDAGTLESLREDVWSASDVQIDAGGKSARIHVPSGGMIEWTILSDGTLAAGAPPDTQPQNASALVTAAGTASEISQRKTQLPAIWQSFAPHPAGVALRGERTSGHFGEKVLVFPSQLRIDRAGGNR